MSAGARHLLIVTILLVLTATIVASGIGRALWSRISAPLTPWQRGLAVSGGPAPGRVGELEEELASLRAENAVLRTRLTDYEAIRGEGQVAPERVVVARGRIVERSARAGRRFCTLDVGAAAGVKVRMPVVVGWSLAGVVAGVNAGRCLVRGITDSESRIPAVIYDDRRLIAEGVLVGTGQHGRAMLDFVEDRPDVQITPGMTVLTSGLDGALPPGLVLGRISSAERPPSVDHWRIEVLPLRDAEASESLLVLQHVHPTP